MVIHVGSATVCATVNIFNKSFECFFFNTVRTILSA